VRKRRTLNEERRWSWWGQTRDAAAATAALVVLGVESYRGTYNPVAMVMVLALLGVVASGIIVRWLTGRWNGDGNDQRC